MNTHLNFLCKSCCLFLYLNNYNDSSCHKQPLYFNLINAEVHYKQSASLVRVKRLLNGYMRMLSFTENSISVWISVLTHALILYNSN